MARVVATVVRHVHQATMAFIVQRLHVACKWIFRPYNIYDIGLPTVNLISYMHLHCFCVFCYKSSDSNEVFYK